MAKNGNNQVRIALNGLGRIGRVFLRIAHNNPHFKIVAAKSRSGLENYTHLLKYDTTYGIWDKDVQAKGKNLVIDGQAIPFIEDDNGHQPWEKLGVDIVVDATGKYTKKKDAVKHLEAGAGYIVATAPMDEADETFVYGVNEKTFDPQNHRIVSAGSCTTVCSSLVVKVLEENFGIKQGFINTVHAVTGDQNLLDTSHKDPRRARAATQSIIPTTTGVSKTISKIYPHLSGKISALSLRVPVLNPSVVVFTAQLNKNTDTEKVNKAFTAASKNGLNGNLAVSDLPLVSTDFRANPNGAIVDLLSTEVIDGNMVNLLAWYDNEWGYVQQMVYFLEHMSKKIAASKNVKASTHTRVKELSR